MMLSTYERDLAGKFLAVVTEVDVDGANPAAVRVQIGALFDEATQQPMTVIAYPCLPPGHVFVPDVAATVVVEFLRGGATLPVWTGVFYPPDATPTDADDAAPTAAMKIIRTTGGQVIQINEDDGIIRLTDTNTSRAIVLDGDQLQLASDSSTVTLNSDGITLDAGGATLAMTSSGITLTVGQATLELSSTSIAMQGAPVPVGNVTIYNQGAVLEPVLQWLSAHQHIGNMGAPTPLFPANMPQVMQPLAGISGMVSK